MTGIEALRGRLIRWLCGDKEADSYEEAWEAVRRDPDAGGVRPLGSRIALPPPLGTVIGHVMPGEDGGLVVEIDDLDARGHNRRYVFSPNRTGRVEPPELSLVGPVTHTWDELLERLEHYWQRVLATLGRWTADRAGLNSVGSRPSSSR